MILRMLWWLDSTRKILNCIGKLPDIGYMSVLVVRMYTCTCEFLFYPSLSYEPPCYSLYLSSLQSCFHLHVLLPVCQSEYFKNFSLHVICHCTSKKPKTPLPFSLLLSFPPSPFTFSPFPFPFLLPLKLSGLLSCFVLSLPSPHTSIKLIAAPKNSKLDNEFEDQLQQLRTMEISEVWS